MTEKVTQKLNNKGFSLVELLVSFAILVISSAAIMGLMSTGMRFFSRISSSIGLQYEYQIVMTQVREYLNDCNAGVVWDDTENALYIVEREYNNLGTGEYTYTTHVYVYDETATSLFYIRQTKDDEPPDIDLTLNLSLVSERMNAFDAAIESPGGEMVPLVTTSMEFFARNRTYSASQDIALRNNVITALSYADLCTALTS